MTDGQQFIGLDWHPPAGAPADAVNKEVYLETDMRTTLGFHSGERTFTLEDLDRGVLAASRIVDRLAARLKS